MKKLAILAGALALGLGACGQNNGLNIGQGFSIGANLSSGSVNVKVVEVRDIKTNALRGYRSTYLLNEPLATFNALPQSVGFKIQSFTVEVLDNAGVRYAADQGKYQRSVSLVIKPGYTCALATATIDTCAPTDKQPANVATSLGSLTLVTDEIARTATGDCEAGTCPTLKLRVTFTGLDDAGRNQTVVSPDAVLAVRVTDITVVKE